MNIDGLRRSWSLLVEQGDQAPLYFYSTLFAASPEIREMFPTNMAGQRERLFTALGHTVASIDQLPRITEYLKSLGRDHRKFAVRADQYPLLGRALAATFQHFLGPEWTRELADDWGRAFTMIAQIMIDAAAESERTSPPWWVGEVIAHERRTFDVAVLTLRPSYLLPFTPGQSISLSHSASRAWRYYSPANAPRPDGTIELHVRATPGGLVSSRLVYGTTVGDQLYLAAPVGERLALAQAGDRDLVLLAGGTGWAPLKALVEQVAIEGGQRQVSLYVTARSRGDLYDSAYLTEASTHYRWLTVRHLIEPLPGGNGLGGLLGTQEVASGGWRDRHVYLCGGDSMVKATLDSLRDAGFHEGQLHHEGLSTGWYGADWRTQVGSSDQRSHAKVTHER
ncbi:globin domain-containing protein [Micromonospora lupini]|uniref:globin domain-containing protein n=1 Tax=Micromonospora lupini TaxID=285679 RepID=UPI0031D5E324